MIYCEKKNLNYPCYPSKSTWLQKLFSITRKQFSHRHLIRCYKIDVNIIAVRMARVTVTKTS